MKALVLEEYNKLIYRDVPDPEISDDEVIVKVMACGICGSDIHGFDGSTGRRIPPIIMGHEASGIITAKGSEVKDWNEGDRVTFDSTVYKLDDWFTRRGLYNLSDGREVLGVSPGTYRRNGAFAEYIAIPAHILYRIPDNVSFEQAAMVEAVAVALHAINTGGVFTGCTSVVIGAGMIGTFLIKLLRLSGCTVIAVDNNPSSLENAIKSGADYSFLNGQESLRERILDLTSKRGADLVFEAVGKSETVNIAIDLVIRGGKVVLVGNISPSVGFPLQKVVTGEIKVLGSCAIRGEYDSVLALLASGKLVVDDQVSVVAPLSEGALWFSRLYNREGNLKKVILTP